MHFRSLLVSFALPIAASPLVTEFVRAENSTPTQASAPMTAGGNKAEPRLTSTIFEWDKLPVEKTANGERREVANGSTPTLAQFRSHVTTLNPGTPWGSLDKHTDEEVVIVKEGILEFEINGRMQKAGPGAIILLVAGETHRSRNGGGTPVTYYVFHAVTAEAKATADRSAKLAAVK